ncbi:MAG: hypothetical protein JSW28_07020 [Thermoplasmata archaeon]|nr:MAG: hypothetical protein JSW28_07020 [Thermoplasmata archaeon]
MRRIAYPYGRYLVKGKDVAEFGPKLKEFVGKLGFSIVKYDQKNEGNGTLIIGVNRTIGEMIKQKKPPGRLSAVLRSLMSGFETDMTSFRDMDVDSQRAGLELYLWPTDEGSLMELFIVPFMERVDKPEIYLVTETKVEEITDWFLCEQIWESVEPQIVAEFDAEPVHRRA